MFKPSEEIGIKSKERRVIWRLQKMDRSWSKNPRRKDYNYVILSVNEQRFEKIFRRVDKILKKLNIG